MADLLSRSHDPELLIFIRHGQTDWNAESRMQGQMDIPLNDTGRSQAHQNGLRLKEFLQKEAINPEDLDFVASPLTRTRSTMELVRGGVGLDPEDYRMEDQLKELTFGDWEGFTFEELADTEQDRIESRRQNKWAFVPPGGGESYEMLSNRIRAWLATVQGPSVVVSHGGVFRVLRGMLEGLDTEVVPKLNVEQDVVFVWRNSRFETH
jgi:broad specificity phosphatase PhoE